jgi:hypothetical protein
MNNATMGQSRAIEQLLLCLIRELDMTNVIDGPTFISKTTAWALKHRVADPQDQDQQAQLAEFHSTMQRLLDQLDSAHYQRPQNQD